MVAYKSKYNYKPDNQVDRLMIPDDGGKNWHYFAGKVYLHYLEE